MKVKCFNEEYSSTLENKLNEFISSNIEVISITYRTASTRYNAWNCVLIVYKDKE